MTLLKPAHSNTLQPRPTSRPMSPPPFFSLLAPLRARLESMDRLLTRRENLLSFLVVRFVLMSGMVVGFSWWALNLSP